jgi:hypothetical protein
MVNWENNVTITMRVLEDVDIEAQDKIHSMLLARAQEREIENLRAQISDRGPFFDGWCPQCEVPMSACMCRHALVDKQEPEERLPSNRLLGWTVAFMAGCAAFALTVWFIAWIRGDTQCPYVTPHGDDGILCCAFKLGHPDSLPHETCCDEPTPAMTRDWIHRDDWEWGGITHDERMDQRQR